MMEWISIKDIKVKYPAKNDLSKIAALDDIICSLGHALWAIVGDQTERLAYEIMHAHKKVNFLSDVYDLYSDSNSDSDSDSYRKNGNGISVIDARNFCNGDRFQCPNDVDEYDDIDYQHRFNIKSEISKLKEYVREEESSILMICREIDFHPTILVYFQYYCDVILEIRNKKITTIKNRHYEDYLSIEFP